MKKILIVLCAGVILYSCAKDDDFSEENTLTNIEKIEKEEDKSQGKVSNKLKADFYATKNMKNVFELVEFHVDFPNGNMFPDYDSIQWRVIGKASHFDVQYRKPNKEHFTFVWSHNFFEPGKYKTFLTGYKDDLTLYSDTLDIYIYNKRDFLDFRWSDLQGELPFGGIGYHTSLPDSCEFVVTLNRHNNIPSITLYNFIKGAEDSKKDRLFNLMKALYKKPICDWNSSQRMLDRYSKRFNYNKEEVKPVAIWITNKSQIMLQKVKYSRKSFYRVYAEPN